MTVTSKPQSVIVVGGGLGGIAAAVRLADRGVHVTLVETRKRLGGRATSFVDPTTGQVLDNCQHVLMGCCTNLIHLYERLGVSDSIQWHRRLYFTDAAGNLDVLEGDELPAPMHMTASLLAFKTLSWPEKICIARGMLAMMRTNKQQRAAWHQHSFSDWLNAQHQLPGAVEKFWANIVISALNELPQRVAADYAIQVFTDGFLCHDQAYVMGLSRVPLVRLYDAAERVIGQAGGRVMLGSSAEQFVFERDRVTGLIVDGQRLVGDCYVSAVPPDRLGRLLPKSVVEVDAMLRCAQQFTFSPIIGIHMWFERRVTDLPHLVLMQSPLQWVFNKGVDGEGQHLHGVISAAHDWVNESAESIVAMAVGEVRKAVAGAVGVSVRHHRVVKEKRATFSACPGIEAIRPDAVTGINNLWLAGDWCNSGWPATMEGAVRSGYRAAGCVVGDDAGSREPGDMVAGGLYQFIAG